MAINRVKLIRLEKGLRQWDLARMAGITESHLSRIETGRMEPSPEILQRLARALRVPRQLLENKKTESSQPLN